MSNIIKSNIDGVTYSYIEVTEDTNLTGVENLIFVSAGNITLASLENSVENIAIRNISSSSIQVIAHSGDKIQGNTALLLNSGYTVRLLNNKNIWAIKSIEPNENWIIDKVVIEKLKEVVPERFPYDKLILAPNGDYVIRYYVSPDGNDNNDGQTWETAKRQIQSVIDLIPQNIQKYKVLIFVEGGEYAPLTLRNKTNGTVAFCYAGEFYSTQSNNWVTWVRNGTSKVFTNDNPVTIKATATQNALSHWNPFGANLSLHFNSGSMYGKDSFWTSAYRGRWGAWKFDGTDFTGWGLVTMYATGGTQLWADAFDFVLGGSTGYGIDINCDIVALISARFTGGSGTASTSTADWKGAMSVYNESQYVQNVGNYSCYFLAPYGYPNGTKFNFIDVAQAMYINSSAISSKNTMIDLSSCTYTNSSQSYNNADIKITNGSLWSGYIIYKGSAIEVTGTPGFPIRLKNSTTNTITDYLTEKIIMKNNNPELIVKNSVPADSDIDNSGVIFWVDEATGKLMIKLKYANGTVKTGEVTLS